MGKRFLWLGGLFLFSAAVLFAVTLKRNHVIVTENEQPLSGRLQGVTVCIDPGHGGYDGGAVGRESGELEKTVNLHFAFALRDAFKNEGANVLLTRDRDIALAEPGNERKRRDLRARVDAARDADLFLSLHMNEYPDRTQSGPQVFYTAGDERSRLLAGAIQQSMNQVLSPARPRSAHTGDYFVLREQSLPAVLIECGFLSNAAEEQKLLSPEYRQLCAQSILQGVIEYLRLQGNLANGA